MNISDHYPKRKSATPVYGYNNGTSILAVAHENNEFSATYDYCMVFPMKGENKEYQSKVAKFCIHEMLEAGLEIFNYLSVQDDELICLIRCPHDKLKEFADKINYRLKIDPANLQQILERGDPEAKINPIHITHNPDITPYTPYQYIYLQYGRHHDQSLYYIPPGEKDAFIKSVRLKLIAIMLESPRRDGGCGLEISRLVHKKKILAFFPLHDKPVAKALQHKIWERAVMPWNVPVEDIREYYGEKIALYYVFLGHYCIWLVAPCIIGLAFQLVVWGTQNYSHPVLPFYSVVVCVWAIIMLEFWKRQEATTALYWGMTEFESEEQERPEFQGEVIKSFINGRDMTYFPSNKLDQRVRISRTIILSLIAIVIGLVAAIYVLRFYLQAQNSTKNAASTIASIINTIQIQIANLIYTIIARKLTDMENHRVDTDYEDALIVKLFVFQFINSYASFFFLAFVASNLARPSGAPSNWLGQCGAVNCMEPLSINLAIIFGTRLTLGNFLDIFLPWFNHKSKIRKETAGVAEDRMITPPEKDYMLLNYDVLMDGITNYADTAVQYGFSLLFITALPCASFFSLVSCYWKVKFNAWKHATFYQRPVPVGTQDIGTWLTIFQVISVAAVITNAGLICFTMDVLWKYSLQGRVWIFIGFQWVLIGVQFIAQAIIPDVPEEVEIQKQRNDFIHEKVIEKVADEDYGETTTEGESDEEDEGDDEGKGEDGEQAASGGKSGGCCSCIKIGGKKSKKSNIKNFKNQYPVSKYPYETTPLTWPKPIVYDVDPNQSMKHSQKNIGESGAETPSGGEGGSHFVNYASHTAAVSPHQQQEEDPNMTRNPTATYY